MSESDGPSDLVGVPRDSLSGRISLLQVQNALLANCRSSGVGQIRFWIECKNVSASTGYCMDHCILPNVFLIRHVLTGAVWLLFHHQICSRGGNASKDKRYIRSRERESSIRRLQEFLEEAGLTIRVLLIELQIFILYLPSGVHCLIGRMARFGPLLIRTSYKKPFFFLPNFNGPSDGLTKLYLSKV